MSFDPTYLFANLDDQDRCVSLNWFGRDGRLAGGCSADEALRMLKLVAAVRAAVAVEKLTRAAVLAAIAGTATPEEREAAQTAYRDAQQSVSSARVALVDAAMEAP